MCPKSGPKRLKHAIGTNTANKMTSHTISVVFQARFVTAFDQISSFFPLSGEISAMPIPSAQYPNGPESIYRFVAGLLPCSCGKVQWCPALNAWRHCNRCLCFFSYAEHPQACLRFRMCSNKQLSLKSFPFMLMTADNLEKIIEHDLIIQ